MKPGARLSRTAERRRTLLLLSTLLRERLAEDVRQVTRPLYWMVRVGSALARPSAAAPLWWTLAAALWRRLRRHPLQHPR